MAALGWGGGVPEPFTLILLTARCRAGSAGKDRSLIEQRRSRSRPVMSRKPKLRLSSACSANRGTRDRAQFLDLFPAQVVPLTKVFADLNGDAGPPARGLHPAGKAGDNQPQSSWWWRENRATAPSNWCARWRVRNTSSRLKSSRNRAGRDRPPAITLNLSSAPCTCLNSRVTEGARTDGRSTRFPEEGEDRHRGPAGSGHRRRRAAVFSPGGIGEFTA
jgi:hypothetical protein